MHANVNLSSLSFGTQNRDLLDNACSKMDVEWIKSLFSVLECYLIPAILSMSVNMTNQMGKVDVCFLEVT